MIRLFHIRVYMQKILSRDAERYLYTHHSSIICNSYAGKKHKYLLIDEWINNMVYPYYKILFSLQREENADTWLQHRCNLRTLLDKQKYCMIPLL